MKTPRSWTYAERATFLAGKLRTHPHLVATHLWPLRPELVEAQRGKRFGPFIRIPFGEEEEAVWLFTTAEDAKAFRADYEEFLMEDDHGFGRA